MAPQPQSHPQWLYGTAWKKERTRELVVLAVQQGFRAIDTANQPKHYNEPAVGEALVELSEQGIGREELFLQTKFTPVDGQDHRLPYDPSLPVSEQVKQSFQSSLEHLKTDYLDSLLLHGPYHHPHLGEEDFAVWKELEALKAGGRVRAIGISNVNALQLAELVEKAASPPDYVQNRCFAAQGWDKTVRGICREFGIVYQGFSLLTANWDWLEDARVTEIARRHDATPSQVAFRFARQVGMLPLTGTTRSTHMKEDLAIDRFVLDEEEVKTIENLAL